MSEPHCSSGPSFPRSMPAWELLPGGGRRVYAPAKINLNLLVGPKRDDGFHPVDSYVCKVTMYDSIDLVQRDGGDIAFTCRGADCGPAENNLALRAARLLAESVSPRRAGVGIVLEKRIPPGKGLGGGSSDAAAVLAGLNDLWQLRLAPRRLGRLGAALGSDVPSFLAPGSARMTGRGERIAPVDVHDFRVILYLPDLTCSTGDVYRRFDDGPAPSQMRQLSAEMLASSPPSAWRGKLVNDLAPAAEALCPALAEAQETLRGAAGIPVSLTGSGSALFMLCDDEQEARRTLAAIPESLARNCVAVALASRARNT